MRLQRDTAGRPHQAIHGALPSPVVMADKPDEMPVIGTTA